MRNHQKKKNIEGWALKLTNSKKKMLIYRKKKRISYLWTQFQQQPRIQELFQLHL